MKLFNQIVLTAALFGTSFVALSLNNRVSAYSNPVLPTPPPTPATRPRTTPSPVSTPTASPTPSPKPIQTLDELQSKIRQRLFDPIVRRGRVGVKVVSLNSGKVIFDQDSEKYFMPASNMKNFTVAAALEKLGADFRFVTSVYANSLPDTTGTIKGDLRIYGRGDVSISTAFNNGDYYKGVDNLVDKIAAAGVKRVEGSIVGDESYFKGFHLPGTWEWDDLQFYYGAEITALPVNDNAIDISVMPGSNSGPCIVTITPANTLFQVNNLCTTGSTTRELSVVKKVDRNVIDVRGWLPVGGRLEVATVTVTEAVKLANPKELLGINLGTTASQVQVPVIYRYFIEMAKEWPITLAGQTLIVHAGEIKTQLPVAFDTRTIEKYTTSGWARFNKTENLDKLERSLSPLLEARAPGYKKLAIESARKSVSDFVTSWLLKHHPQPDGTAPHVKVYFPEESTAAISLNTAQPKP